LGLGSQGGGAFLVESPRQAREAFLTEEDGQGVDADGVAALGQFTLDVVW
jgi:hypothetical protein